MKIEEKLIKMNYNAAADDDDSPFVCLDQRCADVYFTTGLLTRP